MTTPDTDPYFIVRCRVSGGRTGTRKGILREGDHIKYFETLAAAEAAATEMNQRMNHQHSVADFAYWAEEGHND